MANSILISSETRAPVPLPFYTKLNGEPVTVHDFNGYCIQVSGLDKSLRNRWIRPELVGLKLITETDFMAERS